MKFRSLSEFSLFAHALFMYLITIAERSLLNNKKPEDKTGRHIVYNNTMCLF